MSLLTVHVLFSGGDGLVKVWTIKTNECVATLDQHTEKVAWNNIMQVAVISGTVIIMGLMFVVCTLMIIFCMKWGTVIRSPVPVH